MSPLGLEYLPDCATQPSTLIGCFVASLSTRSAEHSTAAAEASPTGQHMLRVSGSAIIGESSTSSIVISFLYWAIGFSDAW